MVFLQYLLHLNLHFRKTPGLFISSHVVLGNLIFLRKLTILSIFVAYFPGRIQMREILIIDESVRFNLTVFVMNIVFQRSSKASPFKLIADSFTKYWTYSL